MAVRLPVTKAIRTIDTSKWKAPVRVTVTGASGQIGYAILFRIASGEMLGHDQPVVLNLLELPGAMNAAKGVAMELADCAFPLLKKVNISADPNEGFNGADFALLVGAKPRSKGMERGDLLKANAEIFKVQGKALNSNANKNVKVLVVGNPANTNAAIAARSAPDLNPNNFMAMTKLDHNRGLAQIADKLDCPVEEIEDFCIWGNHSATQFPDLTYTRRFGRLIKNDFDQTWYEKTFIPTVQQRGAAIIEARGLSSAASAANAAIEHMREWHLGTSDRWTSMAVHSNGEYGVTKGLYFSYPVVAAKGSVAVVPDLPLNDFQKARIQVTHKELLEELKACGI